MRNGQTVGRSAAPSSRCWLFFKVEQKKEEDKKMNEYKNMLANIIEARGWRRLLAGLILSRKCRNYQQQSTSKHQPFEPIGYAFYVSTHSACCIHNKNDEQHGANSYPLSTEVLSISFCPTPSVFIFGHILSKTLVFLERVSYFLFSSLMSSFKAS